MEFVMYYELNEDVSLAEREAILSRVTKESLFPPKGVEVTCWKGTVDWWGVVVFESNDLNGIAQAVNIWRAENARYFKLTKTSPAINLPNEADEVTQLLVNEVNEARIREASSNE